MRKDPQPASFQPGTEEDAATSGPAAPSISLPSGGGAIRGIGEEFSFNAFTGTASLKIPLRFSESRGALEPEIALAYDSGAGNGVFGVGWKLNVASITRKTDKGIPQYQEGSPSDSFMFSGGEELVPLVGGPTIIDGFRVFRYRPRVDSSYARVEWWRSELDSANSFWRVVSRDNVTKVYGYTADGRIADPDRPYRIYSWLLQASYDCLGNVVAYGYREENLEGVDKSAASEAHRVNKLSQFCNRYLSAIAYGNKRPYFVDPEQPYPVQIEPIAEVTSLPNKNDWLFTVCFDYGEHPEVESDALDTAPWKVRPDAFSTYRPGFEVRTYRRCQRILYFHHISMRSNGDPVGCDGLVRSMEFRYATDNTHVLSKLTAITRVDYRRAVGEAPTIGRYIAKNWPPLELEYSAANEPVLRHVPSDDAPNLPEGVDGSRFQWADLDGEGISGALTAQANGWMYMPNRGGRFDAAVVMPQQPSVSMASAKLLDLAGDGALDLAVFQGGVSGMFERTADGRWGTFQSIPSQPITSMDDASVRLVDLTGDSRADFLRTEHDQFIWQQSKGEFGFDSPQSVAMAHDEAKGPRCAFAETEQTIFLVDMTGDGLTDLARIRDGEVVYWPNLGFGRFGAKIVMDSPPVFGPEFDSKRIRVVDADGSGIADIVYLDEGGARYWRNLAGNGWGPETRLPFPISDPLTSVASTDFYGRGTGCLVWSTSAPNGTTNIACIDLTGGIKPHLLTGIRNNLGAEIRLTYESSTQFYLDDRSEGRPWITRLPFPVHVVRRVETYDRVSRNRFVSRYRYHHGFYDGREREFRGFGMVEQQDTESREDVPASSSFLATNEDDASYVPPVVTKTWFHHGAWRRGETLVQSFKREYWHGDPLGIDLADTVFPSGLSVNEEQEACRALRGRVLREEVYATDASSATSRPYRVTERNYTVSLKQPRQPHTHAVFCVHDRETVEASYERELPLDPRIVHDFVLRSDDFGNILQQVKVAYRRRNPDDDLSVEEQKAQGVTKLVLTQNRYTNFVNDTHDWRAPIISDTETFELSGSGWSDSNIASFSELADDLIDYSAGIPEIAYTSTSRPRGRKERRRVAHTRIQYRRDDLRDLLPHGTLESRALWGRSERLAITPGVVAAYENKATYEEILALLRDPSGGYAEFGDTERFYIPSQQVFYSHDATGLPGDAAKELKIAKGRFFRPHRFTDRFDNETKIYYDDAVLRVLQTKDAAGNKITARYDYRVLQPDRLTDANDNSSAALFDTRGFVVATAVLGKSDPVGDFGDTLEGSKPDIDDLIDRFIETPIAVSPNVLQKATQRYVYDVESYMKTYDPDEPEKLIPTYAASLQRQNHVVDTSSNPHNEIEISFAYSDGFGRDIQSKTRTSPEQNTSDPRWVVSGWVVYNNKGNPVLKFQPAFAETHKFQFDTRVGVGERLFYDPLQRVIAKLWGDKSWEKTEIHPWREVRWDRSDTALIDPKDEDQNPKIASQFHRLSKQEFEHTWYEIRSSAELLEDRWPGPRYQWRREREGQTAAAIESHANTPTRVHFDVLGREFLTVTHNTWNDGTADRVEFARTRTDYDIEGNPLAIFDAFEREATATRFDVDNRPIRTTSLDAGSRWSLPNADGETWYAWDDRGHVLRHEYDVLRRPTKRFVNQEYRDPGTGDVILDPETGRARREDYLFEQLEYGEAAPTPTTHNLRGRLWKRKDTAGIEHNRFDVKGNLTATTRDFCKHYKTTPNWKASPQMEGLDRTTETKFDAVNRPVWQKTPDDNITTRRYNLAGQARSVTLETVHSGTKNDLIRHIEYNPNGQRTLLEFGNSTDEDERVRSEFEYDQETFRLLRLTSKRGDRASGRYQDLRYATDPVGNIHAIGDDAHQDIYFRNDVIEPESNYTYDALYRLIGAEGREHPGHDLPANAWDVHRTGTTRTTNCRHTPFHLPNNDDPNGMRRYIERYAYDIVGNIDAVHHRTNSGVAWRRNYTYESSPGSAEKLSNRLVATSVGGADFRYAHDVHGNITSMPHLPVVTADFRDQMAMSQQQSISCDHDRPSSQGERTYYVYDGDGERVRKVTERGQRKVHERLYIGQWEISREYNPGNGDLRTEWQTLHVSDGDRRFAQFESRTQATGGLQRRVIRCQLPNHLGSSSIEFEFDGDAKLISYEEYYPFGGTAYQATSRKTILLRIWTLAKRYRFLGKERDEESGLSYHGARYYAPWLGRWTTPDPVGDVDGTNRFAYARGNPVIVADTTGLKGEVLLPEYAREYVQDGEQHIEFFHEPQADGDSAVQSGSRSEAVEARPSPVKDVQDSNGGGELAASLSHPEEDSLKALGALAAKEVPGRVRYEKGAEKLSEKGVKNVRGALGEADLPKAERQALKTSATRDRWRRFKKRSLSPLGKAFTDLMEKPEKTPAQRLRGEVAKAGGDRAKASVNLAEGAGKTRTRFGFKLSTGLKGLGLAGLGYGIWSSYKRYESATAAQQPQVLQEEVASHVGGATLALAGTAALGLVTLGAGATIIAGIAIGLVLGTAGAMIGRAVVRAVH